MHRKYCITENQLDIDIIFTTISRGMTKLKIMIEMEIMAIAVTLLGPLQRMEELHSALHTPGPTDEPLCVLILTFYHF